MCCCHQIQEELIIFSLIFNNSYVFLWFIDSWDLQVSSLCFYLYFTQHPNWFFLNWGLWNIHSSISNSGLPQPGVCPSCHRLGGRVHPEQSDAEYYACSPSFLLSISNHETTSCACFWTIEGNQSSQGEPLHARGERIHSTRKEIPTR